MTPVRLIIVGAGGRGYGYAQFASLFPERASVVGVAEPRPFYRERLAQQFAIAGENVASSWEELAGRRKFADAVVVATPDALHAEPAIAFAEEGYDMLLEKPMAPNPADCRRIAAAARSSGMIMAVGHVLRYTRYTQKMKEMIDANLVGDLISIQHLEPVGYWHQAHSFVRGNWRNEAESSFMLLAKSCHDLDWLRYIMGRPAQRVSSFGSLSHFHRQAKPAAAGNAARCLDCAYEANCPYSAVKIYLGRQQRGELGWPLDVLTPDLSEAGVRKALREGPYGRCVYECDNDVVDHQVVNIEYAGGTTAAFTMTAFNEGGGRRTTVFGTRGELRGDGENITHFDFLRDTTATIDTRLDPAGLGGHGGGDYGLMDGFIAAVAERNPARVLSGPQESLETHLTVFAAEQARREGRVVQVEL